MRPRETPIKELYIRNSGVPVDEIADNLLYDYCNIQVAIIGMQSSTPIMLGQLWVSYNITLMKNISSQNILLSDQYVFDDRYYPATSAEVFCSTADVRDYAKNRKKENIGANDPKIIEYTLNGKLDPYGVSDFAKSLTKYNSCDLLHIYT